MKRFGILGQSLQHTLSPYLHKELFALSHLSNCEYKVYDILEADLLQNMPTLRALDGFNITIPYKCKMLQFVDTLTAEAQKFESINTVIRQADGTLLGANTDEYGFLFALEDMGVKLAGKVLLLGAGGVAKTMAVCAAVAGASLTIAVRQKNLASAEMLANQVAQFGEKATVTTLDKIEGDFDLLVNATPVGMYPNCNASPVSDSVIQRAKAVFDAVYNPQETLLVQQARKFKIAAKTGMTMLVAQAVAAHKLWYGGRFERAEVDALVQRATKYMESNFK